MYLANSDIGLLSTSSLPLLPDILVRGLAVGDPSLFANTVSSCGDIVHLPAS